MRVSGKFDTVYLTGRKPAHGAHAARTSYYSCILNLVKRASLYTKFSIEGFFLNPAVKNAIIISLLCHTNIKVLKDALDC